MKYLIPLLFLFACTQEAIDTIEPNCNGKGYLSVENNFGSNIYISEYCLGVRCENDTTFYAYGRTTKIFELNSGKLPYGFILHGSREWIDSLDIMECDTLFLEFH